MSRRFSLLVLPGLLLLLSTACGADTLLLKSGEKLEGKIVKESPTEYTIDYKAAAGITDVRTVLKADVEKVLKETPDDLDWQPLKSLQPGAASLPAGGYDGPMHLLQGFIKKYPDSPHAGEAAQALLAFEADKKRVDDGEVKIDGKWLGREEVQKERYQINGRAIYSYMQDLARRGDLVGALNAFDTLEKQYPGASVYPDGATFARTLVDRLKTTAETMRSSWQIFRADREAATKNLPDAQRVQTAAAQAREQVQFDTTLDTALKSGTKWPPLQRQHEKTLTTIIGKAQTESTRLTSLPVPKMRQSLQLAEQARTELANQSPEVAEATIREATKLWNANEFATRLTKEIAAAKAQAKAAATPRVAAATPTPRATPAPSKTAESTPLPQTPAEQPKNFFLTPRGFGAIGIAVLLLVLRVVAAKKKKKADAPH